MTHAGRVFALALGAALLAASGCSGRSRLLDSPPTNETGEGGEASTPSGGTGGNGASGGKGLPSAGRAGNAGSGGSGGSSPPYVDPGCPDVAPPPGVIECDPFSTPSGCPEGLACKPNIMHPFGDGCDQQVFSLLCRPAGFGVQGSECDSTTDCADGYICVVGAGAGRLCLRMCELGGSESTCPLGYICGETDAQGVGVCA